jgi:hypothetical protein
MKGYHNPYDGLATEGSWVKCNFHTHAGTGPGTCGSNPTPAVVAAYKAAGYGALCISNHDLYSDTSAYGDGICMVQGVEYSVDPHMLTIGVAESFHALPHQEAIRRTRASDGFTILCHPNWIRKEYWPWEKLDGMEGFIGIEVINMLIYRLQGSGLAADTWDHILSRGRLVYGFGDDDFHLWQDLGRSFTSLWCPSPTWEGIRTAVRRGTFVASTGPLLDFLRVEDGCIRVKARMPIETYVDTYRYRFIGRDGRVLAEATGPEAGYRLTGEEMYVRVEAMAENGALLFCQPVFRTDLFDRAIGEDGE